MIITLLGILVMGFLPVAEAKAWVDANYTRYRKKAPWQMLWGFFFHRIQYEFQSWVAL
jgi:hypothetical protein